MKCFQCGFFLATRSFVCPNCGCATIKLFEESSVYKIIALIFVVVLYAYGTYIVFTNKSGMDPEVMVGVSVIFILAIFVSIGFFVIRKFLPKYKKKTLSNMEEKIQGRMIELQEAAQKIDAIHQLLGGCKQKLGDIARETLVNARTSLNHLKGEYQTKLCEIEILRLLNRFECIRNSLTTGSEGDLTMALDEICDLEQDCMRMEQSWKTELMESTAHSNECVEKLSQIPEMLNALREALIAGEIRKAVEEIRPLRSFNGLEGLDPQITNQISFRHQLDVLSTELQVLENENIRLKTEQEVLNTISEKM